MRLSTSKQPGPWLLQDSQPQADESRDFFSPCPSLSPFIQELSTVGYLKTPPPGYLVPGVDLIGAMGEMRKKVTDGKYSSQYEFITELVNVVGVR